MRRDSIGNVTTEASRKRLAEFGAHAFQSERHTGGAVCPALLHPAEVPPVIGFEVQCNPVADVDFVTVRKSIPQAKLAGSASSLPMQLEPAAGDRPIGDDPLQVGRAGRVMNDSSAVRHAIRLRAWFRGVDDRVFGMNHDGIGEQILVRQIVVEPDRRAGLELAVRRA